MFSKKRCLIHWRRVGCLPAWHEFFVPDISWLLFRDLVPHRQSWRCLALVIWWNNGLGIDQIYQLGRFQWLTVCFFVFWCHKAAFIDLQDCSCGPMMSFFCGRIPLPYFYKKKKPPKKQRPGIQRPVRWETLDFMLPPLGPGLWTTNPRQFFCERKKGNGAPSRHGK